MKKRKKISQKEEKLLLDKLLGEENTQDKKNLFLIIETTIRVGKKNKDKQNLMEN